MEDEQHDIGVAKEPPLPEAIASFIETAARLFDVNRSTSYEFLNRAVALMRTTRALDGHGTASGFEQWPETGGLAGWQLERLMSYIDQNLGTSMKGKELARLANVSTGHFFRAFKASVGVAPFHYVLRRRLDLACVLMETTDQSLSEIAMACGLYDQAHLCKIFRRMVGESPAVWRRAKRGRILGSAARPRADRSAVAVGTAPDRLPLR